MLWLLSGILGSIIITTVPLIEINRHDQPERYHFWRSVMGGICLLGLLLVATSLIV